MTPADQRYHVALYVGGENPPYRYVFQIKYMTAGEIETMNSRYQWTMEPKSGWYFQMLDMVVYYRGPYDSQEAVIAAIPDILRPSDGAKLARVDIHIGESVWLLPRIMNGD